MAGLEPLQTPVLKVSRPVAACSRCRNAKIKCDGKLPACTSCEKNGRAAECTSANDEFARGKERSYVSTLENQLERLSARLAEARLRKPSVVSQPDDEQQTVASVPTRPDHEPLTLATSHATRRSETRAIDELVSDFGFLSVNATARDFYGFTGAMSYARLVLWSCSKDPLPHSFPVPPLPPRYTSTSLAQHYLNHVFLLLPFFDEANLYASLDKLYSRNTQQAEPLDHWFVRMVLAISSASRSQQFGDQRYVEAIGHVRAALEHAEDVLHPGAITSIQALILFTQFAMLNPHHFDSWGLIGAASRAMVDLGLHQDPPRGTHMLKEKLEIRRRVFHCVYVLDRSTSLVQTRAFSFSDDSTKVKEPFSKQSLPSPALPIRDSSHEMWLQKYQHAVHLSRLRRIQSKWYSDLFQSGRTRWDEPYPYIWATCESMRQWFEDLPPSTSHSMRTFFELDLLYSYVYVLSPSPRVPVVSSFAQKLIFEYCVQYADLMLRLLSDTTSTAPLTFYDAMRVYMTGRQFLDVLQLDLEGLLSGHVRRQPQVKPTSAPPPPLPIAPLPPGESSSSFTIVRSIGCIEQISECLRLLGTRWGFKSWSHRYRSETGAMIEELKRRLGEIDESGRTQTAWQHPHASASIGISNGDGIARQQLMPTIPVLNYHQQGLTHTNSGLHTSPFRHPPQPVGPAGFGMTQLIASPSAQPQLHQPPFQQLDFDFNQPPILAESLTFQSGHNHRPSAQFSIWGGYDGSPSQRPALNGDIAVPPDTRP